MIVTEDGELADGVYVVWQALEDRVQEDVLNVPPAPPSLHDIVPVGTDLEFERSDIVAVSVIFPDTIAVELGDTVTAVASINETEMLDEPELD